MSAIGCGWLGWLGTLVFRGRNGMDWVMTLFSFSFFGLVGGRRFGYAIWLYYEI